jgi:hypothetical protein
MTTRTEWTGTELLGGLAEQVGGNAAKEQELAERAACPRWPAGRAATFLRKVGVEVTFRCEGRARTIRLTAAPENVGARPSAPSALSDPERRPDGGRCCGPSPARYRRNRLHQALEIQCRDRCGRCGRKWRPPFRCSGIAACLNDATVHGCQRILNQLTLDNGPGRREAMEWVDHGWVALSTVHGGGKRRFEDILKKCRC